MFQFVKATKEQSRARIALVGPSGSGKTFTALSLAAGLGERIAVIDTENGSSRKLVGEPGIPEFAILDLVEYSPLTYVEAIKAAEQAGFDVLIIDSLSHAWMGRGGALEQVDRSAKKYQGNSFAAWRDVTPQHNALLDALVGCKIHLIATMRTKTEYVIQTNDKGKLEPRKVGMAPVQREGVEYEFDITADMDLDHNLVVSKTRYSALDGLITSKPTAELGRTIKAWLSSGEAPAVRPVVQPPPQPAPAQKVQNGGAKGKPTDAMTAYWLKVKELNATQERGRQILASVNNDPELALDILTGVRQDLPEAA